MHPFLADRRQWWTVLVAGGSVGLLVSSLARLPAGVPLVPAILFGVPVGLAMGPLSLSAWYLCRAFPVSRTPVSQIVATGVAAAVLSAGLWAAVSWGWWTVLVLAGAALPASIPAAVPAILVGVGLLAYLIALAVTYLLVALEESAAVRRRTLEAEVAQRDAELTALRAQLDPHFLFNSLNSISGLIASRPDEARVMCHRLGEFLRDCLTLGSAATIPLDREVALTEQYLGIEQVRFGSRLQVSTQVAAECAAAVVPPLLLQPLVENAVRHGVATRVDGGAIEIRARRVGDQAVVTVSNPTDEDSRRPGTGLGLSLVRRRLLAAWGEEGSLALESAPGVFTATVRFPLGPVPVGHAEERTEERAGEPAGSRAGSRAGEPAEERTGSRAGEPAEERTGSRAGERAHAG